MIEYIYDGVDAEEIASKADDRQYILKKQTSAPVWFMGRVQHKLTGTNPVRDLRPYFLAEELGLFAHTDWQKELSNIVAIRGWVFQKEKKSVVIRISDKKRKSVPFYLVEEERADVENAFQKETDSVLGFNIFINKKDVKDAELCLEFETAEGYTTLKPEFDQNYNDESKAAVYFNNALDLLPTKQLLEEQKRVKFQYNPLISVIVPLYNTPLDYLKEMIDSVLNQSYSNVQLCLADGSTQDAVGNFIQRKYGKDSRVVYERLKNNGGISENTNAAYSMATGDFIMLCDHDDVVMQNACYEMVKAINEDPEIDVIYTDEDKITMDGVYYSGPHYKPDFNLTFLRDNNYICHIFLVKKSIVDQLEGPELKEYDGAQDFDFILRCTEKAKKIHHIPMVLYHWRCHPLSTAMNPESKTYAYEAGVRAIEDSYKRAGIDATVEQTRYFGRYRSHFAVQGNPLVSIILWGESQNALDIKMSELKELTNYANCEYIITDNVKLDSDTLLPNDFSELNKAVSKATGDYYVFLYQDAVLSDAEWIKDMLGYCNLVQVGICGLTVTDKEHWIYSCGQFIDKDGHVCDEQRGWNTEYVSDMGRSESSREVSSVSLHGMMICADLWKQLNGFDAQMEVCAVADFCLRASAIGIKTVENVYITISMDCVEPYAQNKEKNYLISNNFKEKWIDFIKQGDPMYNPNL